MCQLFPENLAPKNEYTNQNLNIYNFVFHVVIKQ